MAILELSKHSESQGNRTGKQKGKRCRSCCSIVKDLIDSIRRVEETVDRQKFPSLFVSATLFNFQTIVFFSIFFCFCEEFTDEKMKEKNWREREKKKTKNSVNENAVEIDLPELCILMKLRISNKKKDR